MSIYYLNILYSYLIFLSLNLKKKYLIFIFMTDGQSYISYRFIKLPTKGIYKL